MDDFPSISDMHEAYAKFVKASNEAISKEKHPRPFTVEPDETFFEGGFVCKDANGMPMLYVGPDGMKAIKNMNGG